MVVGCKGLWVDVAEVSSEMFTGGAMPDDPQPHEGRDARSGIRLAGHAMPHVGVDANGHRSGGKEMHSLELVRLTLQGEQFVRFPEGARDLIHDTARRADDSVLDQ